MRVSINGQRPFGVTAKDIILSVIAEVGANGAARHVVEYAGDTIRALSIEERLTVCNMSIEAGARAGLAGSYTPLRAHDAGRNRVCRTRL